MVGEGFRIQLGLIKDNFFLLKNRRERYYSGNYFTICLIFLKTKYKRTIA